MVMGSKLCCDGSSHDAGVTTSTIESEALFLGDESPTYRNVKDGLQAFEPDFVLAAYLLGETNATDATSIGCVAFSRTTRTCLLSNFERD